MKLKIIKQRNGWRPGIEYADGVMVLDAHSDAIAEIQALEAGTLDIQLLLSSGGNDNANCYINERKVEVDEKVSIELTKNRRFILKTVAANKSQCWYKWNLSGAVAVPNIDTMPYTFREHGKLGDTVSIIVGLENYAIENGIDRIEVGGHKLYDKFLSLFDFKHVFYNGNKSATVTDRVFYTASWEKPWLSRFADAFANQFGGTYNGGVTLPNVKIDLPDKKEDVILAQFDSRASGMLSIEQIKKIISKYTDYPVEILGGPDTRKYLGNRFKYRIGDIDFILRELSKCRMYIGADSGIAHLAGLLNVESHIYNGPIIDPHSVETFFSSYPNTLTFESPKKNEPKKELKEEKKEVEINNRILSHRSIQTTEFATDLVGRNCFIRGSKCVINTVAKINNQVEVFANSEDGSILQCKLNEIKLNGR